MIESLSNNSLLQLALKSDPLSQGVLFFLVFLSIVSWGLILSKAFSLRKASQLAAAFSASLERPLTLYGLQKQVESAAQNPLRQLSSEALLLKKSEEPNHPELAIKAPVASKIGHNQFLERLERGIEAKIISEERRLNAGLSVLATLSSASPFIGLFGTVLGVIAALSSLGQAGGNHLSAIGPGIAGALVATAMGLLVAIPALIAYNLLRASSNTLAEEMRRWGLELMNLFDRSR